MTTIYTTAYVGEVDVEIDLDEIDTDDLIDELIKRGRSDSVADYEGFDRYEADYLHQIVTNAIKQNQTPTNVILWRLERKLREIA